jgi:hypothetical protein
MKTPGKALGLMLLLAGCLSLCGCLSLFGWTVAAFAPPQTVKAKYKLPKGKKVLVLVDDIRDLERFQVVRQPLTRSLNRELTKARVAAETVPFDRVLDLACRQPHFHQMEVKEVGRRLGADIVLYVRVDGFSLRDHEVVTLWHGRLGVTVLVIDVAKGLLWPQDRPGGLALPDIELKEVDNPSEQYGQTVTEDLCRAAADRIAKLFYDHRAPAQTASP